MRTLPELGKFLKRADADEVLDRCASLAGQRHRLAVRVASLESDEPQLHGAASPDLPRGENLAVFLTLQREPLGQTIYLAGLHVTGREDVRRAVFSPQTARQLADDEGKPEPWVAVAQRPEEAAEVRRQFIALLDDLFHRVHSYNEARPDWKNKLSLQAYVHTEDERALLFTALLEALAEPDLAEKAMTLLFHFQGPELMHATRHPGSEVAYPVVVLQHAIGRLLALPVEVSYTLPEMLERSAVPSTTRGAITITSRSATVCAPSRCTRPGIAVKVPIWTKSISKHVFICLPWRRCCAPCANVPSNICSPGRRASLCRPAPASASRCCRAWPSSRATKVCCAAWLSARPRRGAGDAGVAWPGHRTESDPRR